MRLDYQTWTQILRYSTSLCIFHCGLRDNRSVHIQTNRSASRSSKEQRSSNLKNDVAYRRTSPSVSCSTFHLATLTVKGCDLLLDRESSKMENKHPILKNQHLTNIKHPQSSMEPLNRREPDDYRSSINTRSARRYAIIKVKVLFSGSTSPSMEKEHLTKLAPTSQWGSLYSIILLPFSVKGCRSTSRC